MAALPIEHQFRPQPDAAEWLHGQLATLVSTSPGLRLLAERLRGETSTRLTDWTDRIALDVEDRLLAELGFQPARARLWTHRGGMFPVVEQSKTCALYLRVDDVVDFARTHDLTSKIIGQPLAPTRKVLVIDEGGVQTWAVERHGGRLDDVGEQLRPELVLRHLETFRTRPRQLDGDAGFECTRELVDAAVSDLGAAYASDLFFRAEREYWQLRNDAGALQKQRQDCLGLGWGNHDHHTYRSSREHFRSLIATMEALCLSCRERFYAGAEAGWGAQVMEHPDTALMVFADVDLSPDEVLVDFAHLGLEVQSELGTVGLWCKLHGEAFLQAGMHHLEGQFEFSHATAWFENRGGVMPPFSNFTHLKQCFTAGQRWPVSVARVKTALQRGWITSTQADAFLLDGAIGSHLEILERNDGFKGFNQRGISEIITATDPRRVAAE